MRLWCAGIVFLLGATVARHHERANAAAVPTARAAAALRVAQCHKEQLRAQLAEMTAELADMDARTARAIQAIEAAQANADRAPRRALATFDPVY